MLEEALTIERNRPNNDLFREAAITLYRDALPLLRQSFSVGSHRITKIVRLLSEALIEQGHTEEAEPLLRELQMISQQ